MGQQEFSEQMKALLWSSTCGVILILGLMVAITFLLVRQNKLLKKQPKVTASHSKRRRGHSTRVTVPEDGAGYAVPNKTVHPRFAEPASRPRVPQPLPDSPDDSSPTSSISKHLYEDPDFFLNREGHIYENQA